MTFLLSSSFSSFTEVPYGYLMQTVARTHGVAGHDTPSTTSPDLLHLADLFLNFSGSLFVFAFSFQLGIHTEFPSDLLELPRRFVKIAFRLVLRAGFPRHSSFRFCFERWYIAPVIRLLNCLLDPILRFSARLSFDDNQDHAKGICKWPAKSQRKAGV